MKQQRFAPHGALALKPNAFGLVVDCQDATPPTLNVDGVAVVTVRGPLMHRADFFFDSYEAIRDRVTAALALNPRAIVLDVDSPGGLVSGAFDCARELRAMTERAGVPLRAYVGGQATSAAYALASAAKEIFVSESATIGSIGVIDMVVDQTAQDRMLGMAVQLVTSGARKADSNPHSSISEDAIAATQARVDSLASMFFDLVASHGWGGSPDGLRALQASIMTGREATEAKLATAIATYDQAVGFASMTDGRASSGVVTAKGKATMNKEEMIAALKAMAAGEDPDMAKQAKAALAAFGEEDEPAAEGDEEKKEDEPAAASEDEPAAEGDEEKKEDGPAASLDANAVAAKALAMVHKINVERANEKADAERSKLLASRPDFAPELIKVLRTAPMATVRDMVKTLPRGPARKDRAAALSSTEPTRGEQQGTGAAARLPANEKADLDARMGLGATATATVHTPNRMSFGVHVPASPSVK